MKMKGTQALYKYKKKEEGGALNFKSDRSARTATLN